jgi:hypothetical protein
MVRPLTRDKVAKYLRELGAGDQALRDAVGPDDALWALGSTPLMLRMLSEVPSVPMAGHAEARCATMLEAYINVMLERLSRDGHYALEKATRWIVWLAKLLKDNNEKILHLEGIQPQWMPTTAQQHVAVLVPLLISGTATGLVFGLGAQEALAQEHGIAKGPAWGYCPGWYSCYFLSFQVARSRFARYPMKVFGGPS